MSKTLNKWLDEFVENGADANNVENWPEEAGGGSLIEGIGIKITGEDTKTISIDEDVVAKKEDITLVSGENDGTNWTSISIGNDTYNIPSGGSSSQTYTHVIEIQTYAINTSRYHWFTINIINSSPIAMTWADLYDYIMSLHNKHTISGIYHDSSVSTSQNYIMWAIYPGSGYLAFNINGTSSSDVRLNRSFTPKKIEDTVIAN